MTKDINYRLQITNPPSSSKASSFVKAREDKPEDKQSYKATSLQSRWHVIGSNDNVSGEKFIEKVIKYLRENARERRKK